METHRTTFAFGDRVLIKKDKFLETLDASYRFFRMLEKFLSGNAQHLRAGILQDEPDLLDGLGGIYRNVDGAKREDREIDERPLGTVFRDNGDAITGLYTEL